MWTTMTMTLALGLTTGAEQITISGSSTVRPIVAAAAERYLEVHPDVQIVLGGGGTTAGIKALGTGAVSIAMTARPFTDEERAAYPEALTHDIAHDGIAVFVHAENPVTEITRDQVRAIYTGQITNWTALGGPNAGIDLVCKTPASGTHELFTQYFELEFDATDGPRRPGVFRLTDAELAAWPEGEAIPTGSAAQTGDHRETCVKVLTNPSAIAYAPIAVIESMIERGGKLRPLTLDGVAATSAHVADGSYRVSRPLSVVTIGAPGPAAADFIAFLQGPDGRTLVSELSFVPSTVRTAEVPVD